MPFGLKHDYAYYPIAMVLWRLVYADGETVTTSIADMVAPPMTVILSFVFTKLTGTAAGAAMGLLGGGVVSVLVMITHVFRKSNGVIPIWNFSWRGLRELVSYALTDSAAKFCQCGYLAVVNKLVVMTSSAAFLPVVGMVALVQQLFDLLDRAGDAYMPLAEVSLVVDESAATLILRDTGVTRDVTDRNAQVKSLRDFVIAGLMSSYESCRYLNTIGCNRSVFSFRLNLRGQICGDKQTPTSA